MQSFFRVLGWLEHTGEPLSDYPMDRDPGTRKVEWAARDPHIGCHMRGVERFFMPLKKWMFVKRTRDAMRRFKEMVEPTRKVDKDGPLSERRR